MISSRRLGSSLTWLLSAGIAVGCSGDGCSCVQPIPGGYPEAERVPNAIQVRVSDTGLDKIEADPAGIIGGLIGDGMGLTFPVPDSCGEANEICCPGGTPQPNCGPIEIDLEPQGAAEEPGGAEARLVVDPIHGQERIHITLRARITTGSDLPVHVTDPFELNCLIEVNTTNAGVDSVTLELDAVFSQEPWGATRVDFANATLEDFDTGDISIKAGDFSCVFADLDFIKEQFVGDFLTSFTENITGMLDEQVCKACPGDTVAECNSPHATACTDGLCEVSAGRCLQELGITGRMTGDALLGNASPGTLGSIDVYDVAGGYAATDGINGTDDGDEGVSLGLYGGMLPSGAVRDRCGPPATAPADVSIPESATFKANSYGTLDFDLAAGVHKHNLDLFAYSAYEGGLMCLNIGTRTIDLLTSETLAVLMPSFIDLLHGKVGAMVLGLRPQAPPTIVLGLGTADDNGAIIEPLLDVTFTDLEVDFFGMVDDQWIRLMTLQADVHLPINLDVNEAGEIVPVLGDLDNAFSDLSVKNSEALAESPAELADKFPALLELALPLVADGLGGFALPELGGLRLVIPDGGITAVDDKEFLAIFANFVIGPAAAPAPVQTAAEIVGAYVPTRAFYAADKLDRSRRPRVQLRLGGSAAGGRAAALEWSVRVNGGLWSPYRRNPELMLEREQFWLPGRHRIEVRAREVGKAATTDRTPVVLTPVLHPDGQLPDKPRPIYFHGTSTGGGCDCATGMDGRGAGGLALLLAVVLLGGSRRARRLLRRVARYGLPLALLLVVAAAPAGCSCGSSPTCAGEGGECLEGEVARGPLGRWDSIAADGDRTVVAAYEESYGDLVLVDVGNDPWTYTAIDGLPEGVLPVYHPDSYRGGFVEPGPNVGAWTSVTLRDGRAQVAYQDLDAGVLKFAAEYDDGWLSHVVDADTGGGSIGLYASMAWTGDGNPAIAYMAAAIDDGSGGKKSQLRVAVATTASPTGEADWTVSVLDEAAVSCAGLCGDGLTCLPATDAAGERCTAVTTDCTAECGDEEACVLGSCTAIVPAPAAHDLPGGTGLFARLGYLPDGRGVVVYYQRALGDLMMQVNNTGWTEVPLDASTATDTGMHAALAIDSGGVVHVAYQDALGDQLMYLSWNGSAGTPELVDDGQRSGDRTHAVGAGAAIVAPDGSPIIAYQDGTTSDLIAARRGGSSWSREDVQVGVHLDGFYNAAATASGRTVVSSYRYDRSFYPPGELVVSELP